MLKFVIFASVLCLYYVSSVEAISGTTIANKADSHVESTKWSKASSHDTGRNTNKCNIFINDVMKEVGGSVPQRSWWRHSPIGAGEWGNPHSSYLSDDNCWRNVGSPSIGDVMGDGVHVAFYTGYRTTTSARYDKIVKNSWGFRSSGSGAESNTYAYWRYIC
ncbi:hypothetical protein LOTGIDRAFT_239005 [Lottia gigantea]|uniref:Uncharacterized protein n=1 Tax=Lottia gigantea TaxID=225164 RepID=V4C9Y8_LOTGI|nr:hypothetical protein LOTGIDRAFT_239005 [Lottia gigantea]ESO98599.1 hypothetical protein LOTGIDRAFT_239005 [Lottia gigantea]